MPRLSVSIVSIVGGAYVASLALASGEALVWQWSAIALWMVTVAVLLWACRTGPLRLAIGRADLLPLAVLVALSVLTRTLWLDVYPFHLIADPIRDDGLYPMLVATGRLRPLGWGPYQSMTMILPSFLALFYLTIGGIHFFQIASVTLSAVELIVLFVLARDTFGRREAIVACLVITMLPGHLGFSRTETTMILTSLWTTVLLLAAVRYDQRRDLSSIVVFGVMAGLASTFHSSARSVAFLAAAWFISAELCRSDLRRAGNRQSVAQGLWRIAAWLGAAIVAFGPTVRFMDAAFFHGGRIVLNQTAAAVAKQYGDTVLAYFWLPLRHHLPFDRPLVTPVMGIALLAGAALALRSRAHTLSRLCTRLAHRHSLHQQRHHRSRGGVEPHVPVVSSGGAGDCRSATLVSGVTLVAHRDDRHRRGRQRLSRLLLLYRRADGRNRGRRDDPADGIYIRLRGACGA